ncbi:MAG TPA: clostripain-related cysteine peptidase [Polyangiaceae bacterium]
MAADNDLDPTSNLNAIAAATSSTQVDVVVYCVRTSGTTMYRAAGGTLTTIGTGPVVNTGSAQTLTNVIKWAANLGPYTNLAMILWSHGNGVLDTDAKKLPSVLPESAHSDLFDSSLTTADIRLGFVNAGVPVALIGFDACYMGMVEMAYELRDQAAAFVGSELSEPTSGWPYTQILSQLAASPSMAALALGETISDAYGSTYASTNQASGVSMATVALGAASTAPLGAFTTAFQTFVAKAQAQMPDIAPQMRAARAAATPSINGAYYEDLSVYLTAVSAAGLPGGVSTAAQAALGALPAAVVTADLEGAGAQQMKGLSIFYAPGVTPPSSYGDLLFSKDTGWATLLAAIAAAPAGASKAGGGPPPPGGPSPTGGGPKA